MAEDAGSGDKSYCKLLLVSLIIVLNISVLQAEVSFKLQGVGQYTDVQEEPFAFSAAVTPEFHFRMPGIHFEPELILMYQLHGTQEEEGAGELETYWYRYLLRGSGEKFDIKIGLQKINFGPAQFLRTLQWFDTLNPLDPAGQSDGVEAILLRWYPFTNVNLWFWALASGERDGISVMITENPYMPWFYTLNTPTDVTDRIGGRMQVQLSFGDLGISYHHRRPDFMGVVYREERAALDFRGEFGIGYWAEVMGIRRFEDNPADTYPVLYPLWFLEEESWSITLGGDYTFGLGNGIYTLLEYQKRSASAEFDRLPVPQEQAVVMVNYPLGMFDSIMGLYLEDLENSMDTEALIWQRSYDRLIWQLMVSRTDLRAVDRELLGARITAVLNL